MQDVKERVALTSIAASAGLTVAKAVVGIATGSLAILSEAAHSLLDFAATMMTYFAVRISGKPADEEHQYGHGKVESVSALAETALLFLLSGIVIWEAVQRLVGGHGHAVEATVWAFAVIAVSIVVDFFRARAALPGRGRDLERGARSRRAAFRLRHVVVGRGAARPRRRRARLSAGRTRPPRSSVAVFICIAGWRLGRRTIDTLTDTAPAGRRRQDRRDRCAHPRHRRDRAACVRPAGDSCSSISWWR